MYPGTIRLWVRAWHLRRLNLSRKTTLLKCVSQLIPLDEGKPFLWHKTPESWGFPCWRSKVLYVPQRPRILKSMRLWLIDIASTSGTPMDFFNHCCKFSSRSSKNQPDDPVSLAESWGLPPRVWHEEWSQASGGEAQRAMVAIAVALKPDVLLLDEPTSYFLFGVQLKAVRSMRRRYSYLRRL